MRHQFKASLFAGVVGLMPLAASALSVSYIDSAGRRWADLTETMIYFGNGATWIDAATLCPADGVTRCGGGLTGWTWATRDQVRELFVDLTGLTNGELNDGYEQEDNSTWAPLAMSRMAPNYIFNDWPNSGWRSIAGVTSTLASVSEAYAAGIDDFSTGYDSASLSARVFIDANAVEESDVTLGAFLFRASVPEPGTLALLGLGLAGLGVSRRRKAA